MKFMSSLCLILVTTTILGHLSSRLHLPTVIGELLSGVILGPAFLHWVQPSNLLQTFAEIGVVLLMFMAGLESDLSTLRRFWRPSILVAVLGMILPIFTAYFTGRFFHFSRLDSLFLGVTFAATSVSISIVVLQEMNQLTSAEGATILGAAVVDDILAVIVFSILLSFVGSHVTTNTQQQHLPLTLTLQVGYLIVLLVLGRWVIPYLMQLSSQLLLPNSETIMALMICLSLAVLANAVGLSDVIGAFFAGLAIGQTNHQTSINHELQPIGYAIFIPVFFVSIGLNISLSGIMQNMGLFLVLAIGGIIAKMLGAGLGARLTKFSRHSSAIIGAGMISRGEMALIIAQLGLQSHLFSSNRYSAIIGAIIATTLVAPLLLKAVFSHP